MKTKISKPILWRLNVKHFIKNMTYYIHCIEEQNIYNNYSTFSNMCNILHQMHHFFDNKFRKFYFENETIK